jgi:hypothetical protein
VEETPARQKARNEVVDMSKYMGGRFLKAADIKESGPIRARIADIEIGEKFDKPEAILDDGSVLSLNATNCSRLGRAYGADSDDWIGKEIELDVGEVDFKGELKESILVEPISPPLEDSKKARVKPQAKPQKRGNTGKTNLNDPLPY